MNFIWSVESFENRMKLQEQGIDLKNIEVRLVKMELHNDELVAIIEPMQYPKDEYQLKAKKDCKECKGYGWIRYCLDQDDIKSAPCHICFPETAIKSQWLRDAIK
jgi:hypothetical protein